MPCLFSLSITCLISLTSSSTGSGNSYGRLYSFTKDNISTHAYSFSGCGEEVNLIYEEGVTNIIGINCSNCNSVSLPSTANNINQYAFSGYTKLTSINIPNSVMTIGNQSFRNCTNLTEINIEKENNSIAGAPWGATNATIQWNE